MKAMDIRLLNIFKPWYLCVLICFVSASTTAQIGRIKFSQQMDILKNIYQSCGYKLSDQPTVKITSKASQAAVFIPSSNTILLDEKLLNICKSFGKDSSDALAFILAHELSHAIYKDKSRGLVPINFLNYSKNFKSQEKEEKLADVQGAFMAYLAGYNPGNVLTVLIEKIYKAYNLSDSPNDNYPSLSERMRTTKLVLDQVDDLINVFEASNMLLAKGEFAIAQLGFNYILQFYRGPEILNNTGVAFVMQAMQFFNEETDQYAYPIEIDENTALKKIKKARGPLPIEDQLMRKHFLKLAEEGFSDALEMNPSKIATHINLMCCLILDGKAAECKKYFNQKGLKKFLDKKYYPDNQKLSLVLGVCEAMLGNSIRNKFFDEILLAGHDNLKTMAAHNKSVMLKLSSGTSPQTKCNNPVIDQIDCCQIKSNDFTKLKIIPLNQDEFRFGYAKVAGEETMIFKSNLGDLISCKRVKKSELKKSEIPKLNLTCMDDPKINMVMCGKKRYIYLDNSELMFAIDQAGAVLEIVRFRYY